MKDETLVKTADLIEIYASINNIGIDGDKSSIESAKLKVASILNDALETNIFGGEVIPFKINFDIVSKILDNKKV